MAGGRHSHVEASHECNDAANNSPWFFPVPPFARRCCIANFETLLAQSRDLDGNFAVLLESEE